MFLPHAGLYYDGNSGIWYTYDHQTQQYLPCTDQNDNKAPGNQSELPRASDGSSNRKVIISAPATTVTSVEKVASLPDAVQAAATAAIAAEKKEKEKLKEIKLASKSSILANKKKMNNVLSMWKQRSHEGQATRVALDDNQLSGSADDRPFSVGQSTKSKFKTDATSTKDNSTSSSGAPTTASAAQQAVGLESPVKPRPVSNSLGGTIMGVIRGSGRATVRSETLSSGSSGVVSTSTVTTSAAGLSLSANADIPTVATPFKTDASALGTYTPPGAAVSVKRRFSEMPLNPAAIHKEQSQTTYRDRAAERRNLYGSSSLGDELSNLGFGDSSKLCSAMSFNGMPLILSYKLIL